MFDNINIHKGKSRYVRIKQSMVPVMWNFTVRAVMKPNLSECEKLWKDAGTGTQPHSLENLRADHLLLGKKIHRKGYGRCHKIIPYLRSYLQSVESGFQAFCGDKDFLSPEMIVKIVISTEYSLNCTIAKNMCI